MSEINNLARQAFNTAIIRGKTSKDLSHDGTFFGILEELREFRVASEFASFGNYVLSEERNANIASEENRNVVGDWDVANWEESNGKEKEK